MIYTYRVPEFSDKEHTVDLEEFGPDELCDLAEECAKDFCDKNNMANTMLIFRPLIIEVMGKKFSVIIQAILRFTALKYIE